MKNNIYKKCCNLIRYHIKRNHVKVDTNVIYMMEHMLHAYLECLCLQRKGTDEEALFYNFKYLTEQFLYLLERFKKSTNCFEVLKILIAHLSRLEKEYKSKKMFDDMYDDMFEDYLKALANDDNFVIPPEDIDREADKYRAEPKYTGQEPVKRKWWQLWLCRIKK